MRLLVLFTVIMLSLSGCSRECFMFLDYKCEKVGSTTASSAAQPIAQSQPQSPPTLSPAPQAVIEPEPAPLPLSPCGPEEICEFNIELYSQWLAEKINDTLIAKDYIEQSITITPKCEQLGCVPPPFHNSFEGMLQDSLLFYGVSLREVEDEDSLTLRYQAQVVPLMGKDNNGMSKLILTTTIIKASKFIFSNTSIFTINKWDAWQYRVSSPATVIPITQSLPVQSSLPSTPTHEAKTVIEPQPLTSTNS